ncbi:hypothetical protein J2S78_000674 [Salibacterium salarium]|nr:hypothetical protein [Salibacterium salarium]
MDEERFVPNTTNPGQNVTKIGVKCLESLSYETFRGKDCLEKRSIGPTPRTS